MSTKESTPRMKPMLVVPTGQMKPSEIKKLNDNGICTVEVKNPSLVKFLDPIPCAAERTGVEQAAIQLSRKLLSRDFHTYGGYASHTASDGTKLNSRSDIARLYVDLLIKGTALDEAPTQDEEEKKIFDQAKAEELRRLAREEAKAEHNLKKANELKKANAQKPAKPE